MSRRINVALLILVFVLGSQNYIFAADVEKPLLSASGIIEKTNEARIKNGLVPLRENFVLNEVAKARLDDMFALQYYKHVSPCGIGAKDFVERKGYVYKFLGENINFAQQYMPTDEIMVNSWLNSPGHRSAILSDEYEEIGVAVGSGIYRDKKTAIAVQIFATSLKICPHPDERLEFKIEALREMVEKLKINPLSDLFNEIVYQYNDQLKQYKICRGK